MKTIHNITTTVYIKPEDNEKDITSLFISLFPFNLDKEKVKLEISIATSFEERKMKILKIKLTKQKLCNAFIDNLKSKLNKDQRSLLIKQKESRLDMDNHFFIRIDKEILQNENRFFITDRGNCFHIRISIAAFPANRDNALKVLDHVFR